MITNDSMLSTNTLHSDLCFLVFIILFGFIRMYNNCNLTLCFICMAFKIVIYFVILSVYLISSVRNFLPYYNFLYNFENLNYSYKKELKMVLCTNAICLSIISCKTN